jgi:low affinity Fe/Cu permease
MATLPPASQSTPPRPTKVRDLFHRFAAATAAASGSAWTFIAAVIFLMIWACSYPLFLQTKDPFNTWQLVINTVTTIVTFLMVFLIQNAQNRDAKALHLKLDELIRAHKGARNHLVDLEECTDEELDELKKEFMRIRGGSRTVSKSEKQIANVEVEERNRQP